MLSLRKYALSLIKTLRGFVFMTTVGVAALVFLGATLASSLLYEKLLEERGLETSREIAQQNFNSIYQALGKGDSHTQIRELVAQSILTFPSTLSQIDIYPGPALPARGTQAPQAPVPADAHQALTDGKLSVQKTGDHLRYLYPVTAQATCLQCHAGTKMGDKLGVVAIAHKLPTVAATARLYYEA